MYSERELMIGTTADRLIIERPVPEKRNQSPFITVNGEVEAQPVLPFYFVISVQHPEIVELNIAADPPVADDPIAQVRV